MKKRGDGDCVRGAVSKGYLGGTGSDFRKRKEKPDIHNSLKRVGFLDHSVIYGTRPTRFYSFIMTFGTVPGGLGQTRIRLRRTAHKPQSRQNAG